MKKLNYIFWIKLFLILVLSYLTLISNAENISIKNYNELLIGTIIFFLLSFFGIPAFFKQNEIYYPKWNDNPFLFELDAEKMKAHNKRFFLICFHFSAYLLLSIGFSGILNNVIRFNSLELIPLRNIIFGFSILTGIHRATRKSFT